MQIWKLLGAGIAALALAGVGVGWYLYHKAPPDVRKQQPSIEISAAALVRSFLENEKNASELYIDKVLIVTGTVENIQIDSNGNTTVYLHTGNPLAAITCSFYKDETAANKIINGTTVRIKGICTGLLTDVILNKCSIVQ